MTTLLTFNVSVRISCTTWRIPYDNGNEYLQKR